MDNKSLDRKILDIKAELTNLKTAHPHGLGAFEYFTAEESIVSTSSPQNWTATITFVDDSLFPPLIQTVVEEDGDFLTYGWQQNVDSGNKTVQVLFSALTTNKTYTVKAVSTAQIQSITIAQG